MSFDVIWQYERAWSGFVTSHWLHDIDFCTSWREERKKTKKKKRRWLFRVGLIIHVDTYMEKENGPSKHTVQYGEDSKQSRILQ